MNKNTIKQYGIVMILGVILNLGLYYIAHKYHLPVWMDNVGTAYAAMLLEPTAGLLVAFATNFYQAAVVYDSSSLVYYMVSASVALTIGIAIRKAGKITFKRLPLAILLYIVVGTITAGLLTIWRTAGVPDSAWERQYMAMAMEQGVPQWLGCMFGTLMLKMYDGMVLAVLLPLLKVITPRGLVNQEVKEVVSWKHRYFEKT